MTNSNLFSASKVLKIMLCFLCGMLLGQNLLNASSHREAPLISLDPFADNTDLYAFRSPDNPDMITIIASYVPFQLPQGGPNWYGFSDHVRYEIHIDNNADTPGDDILYYITFERENEDPTTFFNIRLGAQNLKTTYTIERSIDGGQTFETILTDGVVPPPNIGPRSIESGVGLSTTYEQLITDAITTSTTGEKVFCGPSDDPFFVDLGGIFDLGNSPRQDGDARDGVACYNVSTIALQIPISTLLKDGAPSTPTNILDADYVIGVWAAASRKQIRTFNTDGPDATYDGPWVQVSRIGMPLTNEAVVPIGQKDYWNAITPYAEFNDQILDPFFYNPELALYMDDDQFGGAVPAFSALRIQRASLGGFDFGNGQDGLFGLKGSDAVAGTALDDDIFGTLLLPGPGLPRSVDLWPIFHTGAPNFPPYQLATGKEGNPLAAGKPFINNFLPNGGDMLRLNMAVPPTDRNSEEFSALGLINSAVLGLTDPRFNSNADLEFIPNMDGFPNGRRLEDDVTRIELQAVSGAVLAAIGLWYDDYDAAGGGSPVTEDLLNVLTFTTGVEKNDVPFKASFPYVASPFSAVGDCGGRIVDNGGTDPNNMSDADLEISIEAPANNYSVYESVPYVITLTNNGPIEATGVVVEAKVPQGLVFSSASTSQGNYDGFAGKWDVGTIPAGSSATLNQNLFTLTSGIMATNFVQVMNSDQSDPDSSPGNDNDMTADEDDEGSFTINIRGTNPNVSGQLFASSNTQGLLGIFDIYNDNTIDMMGKEVLASDADGLYYNADTDDLIQLNRTDNRLDLYSDVNLKLNNSNSLNAVGFSSSDFTNGREIAVSMDWIAVAQDANDSNGQQNKIVVYTLEESGTSLVKSHDVDINLWGIQANGNDLFAIVDNSNQLAVFNNFYNRPDGPLEPSSIVTVEGIVRTHGITYIADKDMMILTDVGEAASGTDGAFSVIKDYSLAAVDGTISMSEQLRIAGDRTYLGNPVDVAYDDVKDRIFIAERKNEGGRILGFTMPTVSGNSFPIYNRPFMGASAVYFANWPVNPDRFAGGSANTNTSNFDIGMITNQKEINLGTIYPVPATSNLFTSLNSNYSGIVQLLVYNAQGKVLSQISHEVFEGVNTIELDVSNYPEGFYYLKVLDNNSKSEIDINKEKFKFLKMN